MIKCFTLSDKKQSQNDNIQVLKNQAQKNDITPEVLVDIRTFLLRLLM